MSAVRAFTLLGFVMVLLLGAAACSDADRGAPSELLRGDEPYGVRVFPSYQSSSATGFNAFIMNAAKSFGSAAYLWSGDGVTKKITYQGTVIAQPYAASVCHCVGATFQVYMTAFEAWDAQYGGSSGSLKGLTVAQVKQLKQVWYVATSALEGSQAALVQAGLGSAVTSWANAQQGDPVQIWRNNGSGHSVIFDQWVQSGGKITGITYFSCQGSGPGFVSETIGTGTKDVDAKRIHIVHPLPPVAVPDAGPGSDRGPRRDQGRRDAARESDGARQDQLRTDGAAVDASLPEGDAGGCGIAGARVGVGGATLCFVAAILLLGLRPRRARAKAVRSTSSV